MNSLPTEVTDLIVRSIDENSDLANLRLVSKALSTPATRHLFSNYEIILPSLDDAEPSSDNESQESTPGDASILQLTNLQSIIAHPVLSKAVRHIKCTTSNDPNDSLDDRGEEGPESQVGPNAALAMGLLSHLPNLTSVFVGFACICALNSRENYWQDDAEETHAFRTKVLTAIFGALSPPSPPTPNFTSLSIKNLQNVNSDTLVNSPEFKGTLARLTQLRLRIVIQHDNASPESSWNFPELYSFFTELPSTWLSPCSSNLTSLTLHCDEYWGYHPLCDFRGVTFPRLKYLELGNYTFTHDWQIDWICGLTALEKLVLDDSPIVKWFRVYEKLDEDKYFVLPINHEGKGRWRYNGVWSDYLARIGAKMSSLKDIQIGTGEWSDGLNFDGEGSFTEGLGQNFYYALNKGLGPTPWLSADGQDAYDSSEDEDIDSDDEEKEVERSALKEKRLKREAFPGIDEQVEEDKKAYWKLKMLLNSRTKL